MAFVWGTGFELQSLTSGVEMSAGGSASLPTITTSVKRSGAASMRLNSLSSGTRKFQRLEHPAAGTGPFYYQICVRADTRPGATNRFILWNNSGDENTPLWWLNIESDGTLTFHDEDGQIGSASSAL